MNEYQERLKAKQAAFEEAHAALNAAQAAYDRAMKELQLAIDGKDP